MANTLALLDAAIYQIDPSTNGWINTDGGLSRIEIKETTEAYLFQAQSLSDPSKPVISGPLSLESSYQTQTETFHCLLLSAAVLLGVNFPSRETADQFMATVNACLANLVSATDEGYDEAGGGQGEQYDAYDDQAAQLEEQRIAEEEQQRIEAEQEARRLAEEEEAERQRLEQERALEEQARRDAEAAYLREQAAAAAAAAAEAERRREQEAFEAEQRRLEQERLDALAKQAAEQERRARELEAAERAAQAELERIEREQREEEDRMAAEAHAEAQAAALAEAERREREAQALAFAEEQRREQERQEELEREKMVQAQLPPPIQQLPPPMQPQQQPQQQPQLRPTGVAPKGGPPPMPKLGANRPTPQAGPAQPPGPQQGAQLPPGQAGVAPRPGLKKSGPPKMPANLVGSQSLSNVPSSGPAQGAALTAQSSPPKTTGSVKIGRIPIGGVAVAPGVQGPLSPTSPGGSANGPAPLNNSQPGRVKVPAFLNPDAGAASVVAPSPAKAPGSVRAPVRQAAPPANPPPSGAPPTPKQPLSRSTSEDPVAIVSPRGMPPSRPPPAPTPTLSASSTGSLSSVQSSSQSNLPPYTGEVTIQRLAEEVRSIKESQASIQQQVSQMTEMMRNILNDLAFLREH